MFYCYKAFGFVFHSELEIPEFISTEANADIFIQFGKVPDQLKNPIISGVRYQIALGKMILKVDRIAKFLVENGEKITIEPLANASEEDIRLFLTGSVIGIIIHQRKDLALHGSAIKIGEKAVVFSGISGSGKSTLALALMKKGYPVICDDVARISTTNQNEIVISSGFPQMKQWVDSLKKLGEQPNQYKKLRASMEKRAYHLDKQFVSGQFLVGAVFFLSSHNRLEIEIEPVKGVQKFNLLRNNTYRNKFMNGIGNFKEHLAICEALSSQAAMFQIKRPDKGFLIDELVQAIELTLKNSNYQL